MVINEEIKNFVRNTFFFDKIHTVGYRCNDNEDWVYKEEIDYKLSDEWDGDEMIKLLEDNDIIYKFDDDYYHIDNEYLNLFYTDKELEENKALWNEK